MLMSTLNIVRCASKTPCGVMLVQEDLQAIQAMDHTQLYLVPYVIPTMPIDIMVGSVTLAEISILL